MTFPRPRPAQPTTSAEHDLDAFFDSLVWDDWEPAVPLALKDPPTPQVHVAVQQPASGDTQDPATPLTPPSAEDQETALQTLIAAWPQLSEATRHCILDLARGPAADGKDHPAT